MDPADAARQFLSASKPKEKYEVSHRFASIQTPPLTPSLTSSQLFLKGTQLRQLSEEYELCRENCSKTEKILQLKKEELPDLKRAVDAAQARLKGAQKAVTTRGRLSQLNQEKAWAHVAEKESVSACRRGLVDSSIHET